MHNLVISILFCTSIMAKNISEKHAKRLKSMKDNVSYSDLAHENPGCPENSKCNEEMGLKMQAYNYVFKNYKNPYPNLNKLKKKYGIPFKFYTKNLSDNMISYTSKCRHHNPRKGEGDVTYEASMFLKELPQDGSLGLVEIEGLTSKIHFFIPIKDTPIFIKNKKLIIMREDSDNQSYYMTLNKNGSFRLSDISQRDLKIAHSHLEPQRECPEGEVNTHFLGHYCRKIYNFDLKKVETIRLDWACP